MTYFLWEKPTELDRPDNKGYGMPTYVPTYTVMGRTSVFRLMWKITALKRPSNVENRPRVRTQVQTAATHIFEYVW